MEKHLTKSIIILLLAFLFASCTKSNPTPNNNSNNGGGTGAGTSTGNVAFWTSQATGWSSINVYFNNVLAGTTSKYFATTPNCGADGAITVAKPPGTYAFTASSNTGTTWSGTVTVTAGACNTQRLDFPAGTGTSGGAQTGSAAFWTNQSSGWSSINVNVGGILAGTIAGNYFNSQPTCGSTGTVTVSKSPGTYAYTASSNTGVTWSGNVTITAGGCSTVLLDFPSGSNSSGTGNSGSNAAPSLAFWTSQSSGWSSINIYQQTGLITGTKIGNSYVILIGTISGTYFNSTPGCGATGTVTTTLPTAVFPSPYYAKSNTGITWSNIQLFADKPGTCSNVRLDFPTDGSTNGTVVYEQGQ
jgi:hypothetical protein